MPIRYHAEHFEFPQHLELLVLKELPPEFEEYSFLEPKMAWKIIHRTKPLEPDVLRFLVFCQHCGGWVPGRPHEHEIDDLDGSRLCGRRGTEYYCPRCAKEIHFSGMMS